MAVLNDADRQIALRQFVRKTYSELARRADFDSSLLRTNIDNTDAFIESIQSSYNNSLTPAFRTNATLEEKTLMFCYVALRRAGIII